MKASTMNAVLMVLTMLGLVGFGMRSVSSSSGKENPPVSRRDICVFIRHSKISGLVISPPDRVLLTAGENLALPGSCGIPPSMASRVGETGVEWRFAEDDSCRLSEIAPMTGPHRLLCGLKLDINTADVETLRLLPGIGPVKARRLIEMRKRVGRFRRLDELTEISGIGPATADALAPWILGLPIDERGD